jgi:hypothetical protein
MPRNYVRKSIADGKTEDSLADLLNRSDGQGRPKRIQFRPEGSSALIEPAGVATAGRAGVGVGNRNDLTLEGK